VRIESHTNQAGIGSGFSIWNKPFRNDRRTNLAFLRRGFIL